MCVKGTMNTMKKARSAESKKRVRWSTLTVYEFDVAIGGSAIPRHGGPSVGLAKTPTHVWSASLDGCEVDREQGAESNVGSPPAHHPDEEDGEIAQRKVRVAAKARERQQRRRKRVRWLKPFERVTMLTQAGLSEKKIYRMMKECAAICMSRRISIQCALP